MNRGIVLALSAYIFWGVHPVYWKLLQDVPSTEIVSHRILWSLIFFIIILSYRKEWKGLKTKLRENTNKMVLFLPALLIGSNWAMYIWAVNADFIIETSLGYFICPLVSVFLGVFFLKENLRKIQWMAVIIAAAGVMVMTFIYGQFPWISIFLAGTWGLYGLLRKKSPLSAVEGLTIETAFLSIPVIIYLIYLISEGESSFLMDPQTSLLLVGAGITSGLPLIVFITSAKMIDLSLIGILQYVYPMLIFIIGYFVYNEPLMESRMIGFGFIWAALILYSAEGIKFNRKSTLLQAKKINAKTNVSVSKADETI
jgi:chloramphenicol-sensitive protein RarD